MEAEARRPVLALLAGSAALLAVFVLFASHAGGEPAHHLFSARIAESAAAARTPFLDGVMRYLTLVGNGSTMTALTIAVVAILVGAGLKREALLLGGASVAGSALIALLKVFVERPRPPGQAALITLPGSYSFPSGHSFQTMLLATLVATLLAPHVRRRPGRLGLVAGIETLAVLVAVSRVYLGVHWATDVLGSWALALSISLATLALDVRLGARALVEQPAAEARTSE